MAFEKSGCLQLTQEEFITLQNMLNGKTGEIVKFANLVTKFNLPMDELTQILDSGEYRIVED
jgi:hypothetical protein